MTHQKKTEKNNPGLRLFSLSPLFFANQKNTHIHAQDVLLNWAQAADPEEF